MPKELDSRRPADSYARLYDDVLDNPKVLEAGPLAFALYSAVLVYCHKHDTDGRIHASKLRSLLDFSAVEVNKSNPTARPFVSTTHKVTVTGADAIVIADSLVSADPALPGLLERDGAYYVVHDYLLHNNSHAERERIREAMRAGGRKGSAYRWAQRVGDGGGHNPPRNPTDEVGHNPPDNRPNGVPDNPIDKVMLPKVEGRREKNNAPPVAPLRESDAVKDPHTEVALGMYELLGRTLTPLDITECQLALNQFAYLGPKDLLARAQEHVEYCGEHQLPKPRTVAGFADTWRRENDWRADQPGAQKANRVQTGRTTGMTKLGDQLKEATP